MGATLFEKLWQDHLVERQDDGTDLVYIDRVFLHERTGSIALSGLQAEGRSVFYPEHVFCCMDHIVDTYPDRSDDTTMPIGRDFIIATREGANAAGLTLFDLTPGEGDYVESPSHAAARREGGRRRAGLRDHGRYLDAVLGRPGDRRERPTAQHALGLLAPVVQGGTRESVGCVVHVGADGSPRPAARRARVVLALRARC